jgi:DHA3 family macrolide efflux protein-like MFS transporter
VEAKAERPRSMWAPLRNRHFVTLLAGQNLSSWGDALGSIALVWFVYHSTHSVLDTAVLSAVQRLGVVLAGPVAGVFVDRWDRRRTMMAVNAIDMGLVAVLAVLAGHGWLGLVPVYAVLLMMTGLAMLEGPAFHSVMSRVLPTEDLPSGNGLYRSVGSANSFVAQAVGGAVVAAVGVVASLLLDAGSFLFAVGALWLLRLPPDPGRREEGEAARRRFWREIREGWAAVQSHPVLRPILLWLLVATAGGGAIPALVPVVVFQQLHGGPATLGLVEAAGVVGSVGGGLAAGSLTRRMSLRLLWLAGGGLLGLSFAGFGLSRVLALSLGLLVVGGLAQTVINTTFNAFFQASIPADLMGRAFGILGAVEGAAGPLSALAGGFFGEHWGGGPVLAAAALWMALAGLLLWPRRQGLAPGFRDVEPL